MSQNHTRKIVKRTISSLYVLNCFKYIQIYILEQISKKIGQENYIKTSCMVLYEKMSQYFHIVYY